MYECMAGRIIFVSKETQSAYPQKKQLVLFQAHLSVLHDGFGHRYPGWLAARGGLEAAGKLICFKPLYVLLICPNYVSAHSKQSVSLSRSGRAGIRLFHTGNLVWLVAACLFVLAAYPSESEDAAGDYTDG